ncbi:hypothetical protein [Sphingomonas sp.]|uniref:hypothetical protein n=1 Tax=Sphingomonas sp. TaxID=28214 RepID=UPI00286E5786|nr:hypothetical protein [Sphingomonas sp.]
MASNKRKSRNNNPEGKNQYSDSWLGSARDNGLTAAVAVGGAVAAGAFLWSRRAQISEEISRLGEQIGEWRESMMADSNEQSFEDDSSETAFIAKPKRATSKKSQREIAEEALTLKDSGPTAQRPVDPMIDDQLKVGTVAY